MKMKNITAPVLTLRAFCYYYSVRAPFETGNFDEPAASQPVAFVGRILELEEEKENFEELLNPSPLQ